MDNVLQPISLLKYSDTHDWFSSQYIETSREVLICNRCGIMAMRTSGSVFYFKEEKGSFNLNFSRKIHPEKCEERVLLQALE